MIKNKMKKGISIGLVLSMGISLLPAVSVYAAGNDNASGEIQETPGESSKTYEPWKHGYRFVDVLNWEASTDPYAEEMRAEVPLQKRNESFAATQVNPNLNPATELYAISSGNYRSTDVSEAPWHGNMSYDEFSYNAFKFWQYTDYVGAGGRPTSGIERGSKDKEYGTVALPIPAAVNAAHKNGVRALGEYFVPRIPQYTEEWLYKAEDGSFPYAQKLIDIMNYYGFDGYFINQEESIEASYVPLFREMLTWMRKQGCYIQWYDSITDSGSVSYQNQFNSNNSRWVWNETNGRVTDSIFLNYWNNPQMLKASAEYAKSLKLDPLETVFYGVEGGQWKYGKDLDGILDESGNPVLSMAIWGSDFYREQYAKDENKRYQPEYQWASEERERMYFTSPSENAGEYDTSDIDRSDIEVGTPAFKGFSRYITERSVINGTTFSSDFNNGHGMQYFQNGEVSRNMEWTNLNLQDILPTWQWWIEGDGGLNLDWDYGSTYERIVQGKVLPFEYQQIGAYNGGSSLVAYGNLEGSSFINLYKTDLDIQADSSISLTYNKPSSDESEIRLGMIFKDAPDTKEYLPIEDAGEQTDGWKTAEIALGEYEGRELAAVGIELASDERISDYQVNFGQINISDGTDYAPSAPENFKLEKVFDETGELSFSWELEDYDTVKAYYVYAGYSDGSERFVGGTYADNLYIQNLEDRDNIVSFKLRAVGKDGSESEATVIDFNNNDFISDIKVVSDENKLDVTWEEANEDFDSVEVTLDYFYDPEESVSTVVEKGEKHALLNVPLEDGSRFFLTFIMNKGSSSASQPVNYFGTLADHYAEPYDGELRFTDSGGINFTAPSSSDWKETTLDIEGQSSKKYTRFSGSAMRNIAIPEDKVVSITVKDLSGNESLPVRYMLQDGQIIDLNLDPEKEISADEFPDEALRETIKEKIGSTIGNVTSYEGALDLSDTNVKDLTGLGLITGITKLDISGSGVSDVSPVKSLKKLETLIAKDTEIETIKKDTLPLSLVSLELSDNGMLISVEEGAISALINLESLRIQNCPALKTLYLTGTTLKEIDLTGCTALTHFYGNNSQLDTILYGNPADFNKIELFDISGSRFDLLDGTSERGLLDALAEAKGTDSVKFDGQKPEAYIGTMPESVIVQQNSEKFRVMDYFDKLYKEAKTVRGNLFAELQGKDWIASDYVIADKITPPGKVYVEILDSEGNVINRPEDTGEPAVDTDTNVALKNATVLGGTGQNSGETYAMLFDGKTSTKWCTNGNSGWMAFYLGEAVTVGNWKTTHAEVNNEPSGFNTEDFELQILNTDAVGTDEEAFITSKPGSAILGNDKNWTTISHITGNTQMVVDTEIEDAPEARVYRLKVNKSINEGQYAAIRIHELELYAADAAARDYDGIFEPDTAGTYQANFMKGKKLLNTLTIDVQEEGAKELRINTEPEDFVGSIEETAIFAVEAEGTGLTYQWQYCNADSNIWRISSMAGNDTMEIHVPVTNLRDGQKYRCVVTDADHNTVISKAAALKVGTADGAPIITEQPADYTGAVGKMAVFVVKAEGTDLNYQWQYCNTDSNIWRVSSMEGNQTNTVSVPVWNFRNGQKYRCVVTSDNGRIAISDVVEVSVE